MASYSKSGGLKINVFDDVLIWVFIAAMIWSGDATEKERAKNPHSMGAAIACRIGGASFCPALPPGQH